MSLSDSLPHLNRTSPATRRAMALAKPVVQIGRVTPERYRDERGDVQGYHYGSAFGYAEGKPSQGEL